MFDTHHSTRSTTAAPWQDHLAPGDAVAFSFPVPGDGSLPYPRPCLVLDLETLGEHRMVLLACGKNSPRPSVRISHIDIRGTAACRRAGVDAPTRFCGTQRLLVPLAHGGFDISPESGSPILGRLGGEAYERMRVLRAQICVLRGLRAERRRSRRGYYVGRPRVRGRDFEVETGIRSGSDRMRERNDEGGGALPPLAARSANPRARIRHKATPAFAFPQKMPPQISRHPKSIRSSRPAQAGSTSTKPQGIMK